MKYFPTYHYSEHPNPVPVLSPFGMIGRCENRVHRRTVTVACEPALECPECGVTWLIGEKFW